MASVEKYHFVQEKSTILDSLKSLKEVLKTDKWTDFAGFITVGREKNNLSK